MVQVGVELKREICIGDSELVIFIHMTVGSVWFEKTRGRKMRKPKHERVGREDEIVKECQRKEARMLESPHHHMRNA